ncbi:hypothetical protein HMPREF9209_2088 [Lactobacillus gasseri 224-1]|uniref:Uncharacterized protein n=1 Tax=Lactobacillus gasseri 224-1 TaxID=679196 RepID=D1YKA9_LACGS|nr:hypothetical protein HMPREF9209_2088 [Lactobacillus gasseri 224-1]
MRDMTKLVKAVKKLIKAIHDLWKKNKQTKKPLDDFWQS